MMSAPSFMQDPPDYNQTIDQVQSQSRSFTNWIAPAEWESYHGHESSAATSAATNTTTRSHTELLTYPERTASQDNYSFLPSRRKHRKLKRANSRQTVSSPGTYPPERPRLVISTPIPHSFTKNGAPSTPYSPRTPRTPPPAFSSPTTYRQQQLNLLQQQQQQQFQQIPYASGSRSQPQSPTTPSRERSVKFSEQQYRSSPRAI